MVLFTKAIVRSKHCRTFNEIVSAYESLVTETEHAHYALREKNESSRRKHGWRIQENELAWSWNITAYGASRAEEGIAEGEIFTFPFGNR